MEKGKMQKEKEKEKDKEKKQKGKILANRRDPVKANFGILHKTD